MRISPHRRLLAVGTAAFVAVGLLSFTQAAATAASVPYQDPAATGLITLCNSAGQPMTGGSIYGKPFVWRAVGATAATSPYNAPGRTAALFGYQPIKNVDPEQWNGQYLTASGRYTDAQAPMTAATAADPTLADFLTNFPPRWDGLIQLRLFLGAPGQPTLTGTYDDATIKISGDNWSLVQGGSTGCATGSAISSEMILPSVRALPTPPVGATSLPAGVVAKAKGKNASARSPTASSTPGGGPSPSAGAGAAVEAASTARTSTSSAATVGWVLAALAVVVLAGAGFWWRRARAR
jgi:hypothetical protein